MKTCIIYLGFYNDQATGSTFRGFESRQVQDILLFSQTFRQTLAPTQRTGVLYEEVNRSGCDVGHSPSSSAEVKNGWSYTTYSPICLHGVDRNNFTFLFCPGFVLGLQFNTSRSASGRETLSQVTRYNGHGIIKYFKTHCTSTR